MLKVTVTGQDEVLRNLEYFMNKTVRSATSRAIDDFCKECAVVAKKQLTDSGRVDTGALRASIEGGVVRTDENGIEGQVGAGNERVIRGSGSYQFSPKLQRNATPQSTSQYAWRVEFGQGRGLEGNPSYFITSAFNFAKGTVLKRVVQFLQKYIKGI